MVPFNLPEYPNPNSANVFALHTGPEDRKLTFMSIQPHKLPYAPAHKLWNNLKWRVVSPQMTEGRIKPLAFPEAPTTAGLYRVTLIDQDWWKDRSGKILSVKATRRIDDAHLDSGLWRVPVLLTIGKTADLRTRLRQHFGSNDKNNRLLTRLRSLFSDLADDSIRRKSLEGLCIEIAECPDWRRRFLAEHYGSAACQPLFDFEAEH